MYARERNTADLVFATHNVVSAILACIILTFYKGIKMTIVISTLISTFHVYLNDLYASMGKCEPKQSTVGIKSIA